MDEQHISSIRDDPAYHLIASKQCISLCTAEIACQQDSQEIFDAEKLQK